MASSIRKTEELPAVLKVEHVAEYLGVSRATAYELAKQPDFPALRINAKRVVIPRDRFLQWVDGKAGQPLESYSATGRC